MGEASILVVDDTPEAVEIARRHLSAAGYQVHTASGVRAAIELLDAQPMDLVITDLKMPDIGGLDLVRHVRDNFANTEIMVVTAYATVAGAVTAVKSGAEEYLGKPYGEQELLEAVERALERQQRMRRALESIRAPSGAHEMIGKSPTMEEVFRTIEKAARSDATVLITGESGVGKELVARSIHRHSRRASGPLVPVNCGAIPQELFENQLFGHAKGAFTGASEAHQGFFQAAHGGTLFLDEISELSLKLQVKLLRVLQDKEVYPIGSTRPVKVDVRILAATGKDLDQMIEQETFRQDLFFRLSVLRIHVPPLRERGEDILELARHFAKRFAEEQATPVPELSPEVTSALERYDWPGNVRELENLMHRLVVMTEGREVATTDLPAPMRFSVRSGSPDSAKLEDAERSHIRRVLESVGGNKTRAAKILGIDRKTLREKLKNKSE